MTFHPTLFPLPSYQIRPSPVDRRSDVRFNSASRIFQRLPELRRDFVQRPAFRLVVTKRPSSGSSTTTSRVSAFNNFIPGILPRSNLTVSVKKERKPTTTPGARPASATPAGSTETTQQPAVCSAESLLLSNAQSALVDDVKPAMTGKSGVKRKLRFDPILGIWTVMGESSPSTRIKSEFDCPGMDDTSPPGGDDRPPAVAMITPGIRAFSTPKVDDEPTHRHIVVNHRPRESRTIRTRPVKRMHGITVVDERGRARVAESGRLAHARFYDDDFTPEELSQRRDERAWMESKWHELAALRLPRGIRPMQDATCRMIRRAVDALERGERWVDFIARKREIVAEIEELMTQACETPDDGCLRPYRNLGSLVSPPADSPRITGPPPGWRPCRIDPRIPVSPSGAVKRTSSSNATAVRKPLVADLNNSTHRDVLGATVIPPL